MSIIAITIQSGNDLDAALDQRFGRAPHFLVVETDDAHVIESFKNDAAEAAHAAGPAAARLIAKHRVQAVVSGRYGPKAAEALLTLGIRTFEAGERTSVREIVNAFRGNSLHEVRYP